MIFTVSELVYRFVDRDVILVAMGDGVGQPMYRSTGTNSGMPGTWLPFDGISHNGTWFNKARYCTPVVSEEFHRFGNQNLKDLSQALGTMEIPIGRASSWVEINEFISFDDTKNLRGS